MLRFEAGNLGDYKHLDGGVWEARLMFGPGYRLYFGKEGDELVSLLVVATRAANARTLRLPRFGGHRKCSIVDGSKHLAVLKLCYL